MPLWTYIFSYEAGLSALVIACISIAAVILLGVGIFVWYYWKKKVDSKFFSVASDDLSAEAMIGILLIIHILHSSPSSLFL